MNEQVIKQTGKEIIDLVKQLVFSPIQTILKNHDFSWKTMAIYFGSVSLAANLMSWLLSGGYRYGFAGPIEATIAQMVLSGITLFVAVFWLQNKGFDIKERELAQVWLKSAIFATVVSAPASLLSFGMSTVLSIFTIIAMAYVLIRGSYEYFLKVKNLEESKAKEAAKTIGIVILTLPLVSGLGLGTLLLLFFH